MDNAAALYRLLMILKAAILAVSLCGCYAPDLRPLPDDTVPVRPRPRPDRPDKPDVIPAGTVVAELADQIPANIETTDALLLVIQILKDGGDWTEADTAKVSQALPDITTAKRKLTADDAARLRGAK